MEDFGWSWKNGVTSGCAATNSTAATFRDRPDSTPADGVIVGQPRHGLVQQFAQPLRIAADAAGKFRLGPQHVAEEPRDTGVSPAILR